MLFSLLGCSCPITLFLIAISYISVSLHRPGFQNLVATLPMLSSVWLCSSPNTIESVSVTAPQALGLFPPTLTQVYSCRLPMLISVSKCSSPSTLLLVFITCTIKSSSSSNRSESLNVYARSTMLISVLGCSDPSTLNSVSMTCISRSSASFHRPRF